MHKSLALEEPHNIDGQQEYMSTLPNFIWLSLFALHSTEGAENIFQLQKLLRSLETDDGVIYTDDSLGLYSELKVVE